MSTFRKVMEEDGMGKLIIYAGNSNLPLAREIAHRAGSRLSEATVESFPDGETRVRLEESVRGADVFIIQSICPPANHHLMELLLMIDAARRASAKRVTAIIPYYAYARQEKKLTGREPISAKLVANLIATAGADRVLTVDLHSPAIEGFFDIPVDHLRSAPIMADYLRELGLSNLVVVSPDVGGVKRANRLRQFLDAKASLAVVFKERPEEPTAPAILGMVGEVEGKTALIIDDIIATGDTIIEAAEVLVNRGARKIYVCAVHPVFAPGAVENLLAAPIEKIVVTNTIPIPSGLGERVVVVDMAPLLAEAIRYIHEGRSMTTLFDKVEAEWRAERARS